MEAYRITQNLECLPFAGGWAEQPWWIVRALETLKVESAKADGEERELKQQEAEDARKYGRR